MHMLAGRITMLSPPRGPKARIGQLVLILPASKEWKAEWTLAITQIFNPRRGRGLNLGPSGWYTEILPLRQPPPLSPHSLWRRHNARNISYPFFSRRSITLATLVDSPVFRDHQTPPEIKLCTSAQGEPQVHGVMTALRNRKSHQYGTRPFRTSKQTQSLPKVVGTLDISSPVFVCPTPKERKTTFHTTPPPPPLDPVFHHQSPPEINRSLQISTRRASLSWRNASSVWEHLQYIPSAFAVSIRAQSLAALGNGEV